MFQDIGKGRGFKATARRYSFTKIFTKYNEVTNNSAHENHQYDGHKLAIFNAAGFLEIAIYRSNLDTVGGASSLLGLSYRDQITIDFISYSVPEFTPIS